MDLLNQVKELYSDADIVVIDKPAGLMAHPDGRGDDITLVNWVRQHHPEMEGVGESMIVDEDDEEGIERPGIVHRLDKDTSGVLILARTPKAHAFLKQAFMDREVRKTYRAFVYGTMRDERGMIDRPIGKSRSDFRRWSAERHPRGTVREARTDYRTLTRGQGTTYLEVFPQTGRTHQIRVHFSALQHPIVHDELYAPGKPALLGFNRLALHAKSIRLVVPSGKEMTFEAPLPLDFIEAERLIQGTT